MARARISAMARSVAPRSTSATGSSTMAVVKLAAAIARTVRRNPVRTAVAASTPRSKRRSTAS